MKINNRFFLVLILVLFFYLLGGLTIRYELFPYNIFKSRNLGAVESSLINYENKSDFIKYDYNSPSDFLEDLKSGGFIFYIRHADKFENDSSKQIRGALDSFESISKGTHFHPTYDKGHALSEYGKIQSWILNKVLIEELKIPFGKIISSPIKRCKQTANIIFEQNPKTSDLLIYDGILKTSEINQIIPEQLDMFYNSFSESNNTAIVGHGFPVLERIGIKASIGQSETLILRKNSTGKLEVVEWYNIGDWVHLLERKSLNN